MNRISLFIVQVFFFVSSAHADGTLVRPGSFDALFRAARVFTKDSLSSLSSLPVIGLVFRQNLQKSDEIKKEMDRRIFKREKTRKELKAERNERIKELWEIIQAGHFTAKEESSEKGIIDELYKLLTQPLYVDLGQEDESSVLDLEAGILEQPKVPGSYVVPGQRMARNIENEGTQTQAQTLTPEEQAVRTANDLLRGRNATEIEVGLVAQKILAIPVEQRAWVIRDTLRQTQDQTISVLDLVVVIKLIYGTPPDEQQKVLESFFEEAILKAKVLEAGSLSALIKKDFEAALSILKLRRAAILRENPGSILGQLGETEESVIRNFEELKDIEQSGKYLELEMSIESEFLNPIRKIRKFVVFEDRTRQLIEKTHNPEESYAVIIWSDKSSYSSSYSGNLLGSKRNGHGTFKYANGDTYVGNWSENKRNGKGVLTCSDGSKYDGDWLDGKRNGKGVFTGSDGSEYDGDLLMNKASGYGTFKYANGETYVGDWLDGKRNGQGTKILKDGTVLQGIWENNELKPSNP